MFKSLLILSCLVIASLAAHYAVSDGEIIVLSGNSGNTAYTTNATGTTENPVFRVSANDTITFRFPGSHPLVINYDDASNDGNLVDGAAVNGQDLEWTVNNLDSGKRVYYRCTAHSAMKGFIDIDDGPAGALCKLWGEASASGAACEGFPAPFLDNYEQCKNIMSVFPAGKMYETDRAGYDGDTAGQTIGCRLYHLGFAVDGNPDAHCNHGSLLSYDIDSNTTICDGTPSDSADLAGICETYCILATGATDNTPCGALYPDSQSCMAACMAIGPLDGTDVPYDTAAGAKDTQNCNIYHLSAAYASGMDVHCSHGYYLGAGSLCSTDPCIQFCNLFESTCGFDNYDYADKADCMSACSGYDATGIDALATVGTNAAGDDTLACRAYHLTVAASAAAGAADTHCPHAQKDGQGICGGTAPSGASPTGTGPAPTGTGSSPTGPAPTGGNPGPGPTGSSPQEGSAAALSAAVAILGAFFAL